MAMLAEPRRKQRIGPNPRGKFFTDDQDNIGRQMLKKMGWKSGDGLGATSQGMSEPIKPKIHTDARGLGYDKTQDPWVAHNEEFEQLLKNLNASTSDDNAGVKSKPSGDLSEEDSMSGGLETKSKTSRARIHYHKFVKNKDLSRASTKDISCIFGKAVSEIDNSLLGNPDKNSDVCLHTNNTAFKWEFKNSFETNEGSAEIGENKAAEESSNEKRKKKKKKRNKEKENEVIEEEEGLVETQQEEIVPNEEECGVKTKKKKKKHRNEDNQSALLEEDNATQTNQIEDDINSSEQDSVKKRKKSKKRKHSNDEDQSNISEVKIEVAILNGEPVVENTENELESIEENNLQTNQFENDLPSSNSSDQDSVKKRKKSKKRKRENDEEHQADNIEQVEAVEPICEAVDEEQRSKKKKKRKKSKDDTAKDELLTTEDTTEVGKEASADAEPKPNNQEPPNNDNVESFGSLQFINRGSIEDYFRNKRLEMLNRLKAKGNTSV